MPILTDDQIIKYAFTELSLGSDRALPSDLMEIAVTYLDDAWLDLRQRTGLNPRVYAPQLAQIAAKEYIKPWMLGTPGSLTQTYLDALSRWNTQAQHQHYHALRYKTKPDAESSAGAVDYLYLNLDVDEDGLVSTSEKIKSNAWKGRYVVFERLWDDSVLSVGERYLILSNTASGKVTVDVDTNFGYDAIYDPVEGETEILIVRD